MRKAMFWMMKYLLSLARNLFSLIAMTTREQRMAKQRRIVIMVYLFFSVGTLNSMS